MVITLVAVFMLAVIGAMAALSIDVVTIYTARSEAQLAADAAALAAVRVLANSGVTSDPNAGGDGSMASAWNLAGLVALQVAEQNQVAGTNLTAAQITIPASPTGNTLPTNPNFTVSVQVTNLPTFFARIWGAKFVTVGASATAEAYNPSGATALTPVAPLCVKPWLLPNIDPSSTAGNPIFVVASGAIYPGSNLLGWSSYAPTTGKPLQTVCTNCALPLPNPVAWNYYPGDTSAASTSFPPPSAVPSCAPAMTTAYEQSVAGCVQIANACNGTANIDTSDYFARKTETAEAVNCLTHATFGGGGDYVDTTTTSPPFQFIAGLDNPIAGLAGSEVMVSDSIVTVPVFNSTGAAPTSPVTIIGFVQLFLSPRGTRVPTGGFNRGNVDTTVINIAGCGTGAATGQTILGNGASPVAVRLISAP